MKQSVPEFYARDRQAWRAWLAKNHEIEQSVWLVYDKGKNRALTWADIVQEALCFGWIDSVAGTVSDTQGKIYVARRKPKSGWSKINKAHIDELLSKNLMQPAGLRAIELAKQNGSWDALNKSDALEYPALLTKLLSQDPQAKKHFEAFTPSAKRIILEWIYAARREETQQKRIEETVKLAHHNIKANQYQKKSS